jgi:hypothetical protein
VLKAIWCRISQAGSRSTTATPAETASHTSIRSANQEAQAVTRRLHHAQMATARRPLRRADPVALLALVLFALGVQPARDRHPEDVGT